MILTPPSDTDKTHQNMQLYTNDETGLQTFLQQETMLPNGENTENGQNTEKNKYISQGECILANSTHSTKALETFLDTLSQYNDKITKEMDGDNIKKNTGFIKYIGDMSRAKKTCAGAIGGTLIFPVLGTLVGGLGGYYSHILTTKNSITYTLAHGGLTKLNEQAQNTINQTKTTYQSLVKSEQHIETSLQNTQNTLRTVEMFLGNKELSQSTNENTILLLKRKQLELEENVIIGRALIDKLKQDQLIFQQSTCLLASSVTSTLEQITNAIVALQVAETSGKITTVIGSLRKAKELSLVFAFESSAETTKQLRTEMESPTISQDASNRITQAQQTSRTNMSEIRNLQLIPQKSGLALALQKQDE